MLPKITGFASVNSLQWIYLLGAGSVAIFGALGGSGIKPAQADSPEPEATLLEPSQAQEPTDGIHSQAQKHEPSVTTDIQAVEQPAANFLQAETMAQQLPTKVTAAPSPQTPVLSRTRTSVADATLTLTPTSPLPPILAGTTGNSNQDWGRSRPATQTRAIATDRFPVPDATPEVSLNRSNTTLAQLPSLPQTPSLLPVPATPIPVNSKRSNPIVGQPPALPPSQNLPLGEFPASPNLYNPTVGQLPYLPQPQSPVPATGVLMLPNPYNQGVGQSPYYPQAVILVPVSATGMPMSPNPYNPGVGQSPYYPQVVILLPVPATGVPMLPNPYNQGVGQLPYYPQNVPPLPAPLNQSPVGFNNYNPSLGQPLYYPQSAPAQAVIPMMMPMGTMGYNPSLGQSPYYRQNVPPLPAPLNQSPVGFNNYNPSLGQPLYYPQSAPPQPLAPMMMPVGATGYNPSLGQSPYYPQNVPPLPAPLNQSPVGFNNYNPGGQFPYSPQGVSPLSAPLNQSPVSTTSYNPTLGQSPNYPQPAPPLPYAPNSNLIPPAATPTASLGATPATPQPTMTRSTALTAPSIRLQGAYVNQGDDSAARARISALYPINPRVQLGATLDLISGENIFSDSRGEGLNLNELYVATAPFENLPNFRLVAGQMDLTSYFDRNSFAKDGVSHFFNPVFQTNPALSATGIASRPGVLVNWTVTDNIEAKAAVFSSARDMGDFSLDGFVGEIGIRYGNAIIRGTYASDRDAGSRDSFREIFAVQRSDGGTGIRSSDREQAYGVNVEYFIPQLNMGIFGRYGRYDNRTLGRGGDTYSAGISFLDVFTTNDRLGLAYGRGLSNDVLRRQRGDEVPDVLELFYDFRFLPNLRLGFTVQQRNGFTDTYAGFRVKTDFEITPSGRLTP